MSAGIFLVIDGGLHLTLACVTAKQVPDWFFPVFVKDLENNRLLTRLVGVRVCLLRSPSSGGPARIRGRTTRRKIDALVENILQQLEIYNVRHRRLGTVVITPAPAGYVVQGKHSLAVGHRFYESIRGLFVRL